MMVKIRRAYEALFLGLFLFFLLITDLRYLKGWPVSLFLEATPLVAVATALTTHTIYRNLVWGLVIIAVTMMLGRVWCNWMCPFGILHHLFGYVGNRRNTKQLIEVNRYRKIYAIKYYILAAMLAMASLWMQSPTGRIESPRSKIVAAVHGRKDLARRLAPPGVFCGDGRAISRRSAEEHKRRQQHASDRPPRPDRAHGPVDDDERLADRPQGDGERLHRAARILAGVGRRDHLRRVPGGQLVDPSVLLPGDLPARGIARPLQPVLALADRPRPGALHRLRPLPEELRRRERPAQGPAQERVLRLPELHRGLPARRPLVPVPAAKGERGDVSGGRSPPADAGGAVRAPLLPDGAGSRAGSGRTSTGR